MAAVGIGGILLTWITSYSGYRWVGQGSPRVDSLVELNVVLAPPAAELEALYRD